jgi:perosamine synthetase
MDKKDSLVDEQLRTLTISDTATLRDAMRQLNINGAGSLFIVDANFRLVGMLTDGDIRRCLLDEFSLDTTVTEVMNRNFRFVRQGERPDLRKLGVKIKYLPVVDQNDGLVDFFMLDARSEIPVAKPLLAGNEAAYVAECIATNWISSQGRFVRRFEHDFAAFCNAEHAAATCNGTAALHLALAALDVGPGDEVIVPSLTFIATANSVRYTGAIPVFADCESDTWNLDPAEIGRLVTSRTKAVIVVHLYGQPARMDEIMEQADRHGLTVIEDAAEAHGAMYKGRMVGGIGHLGCFSFFGNKIITTGEGGMVVCNSGRLADRVRILRDHGMDPERRYWHPWVGFNYRMTNLQAAVGCAQLERIDEILESKRQTAKWYASRLTEIRGLTLPPTNDWSSSVFWMFSVLVDENLIGLSRDLVLKHLQEKGIEGRPFFYPAHKMPPYEAGIHLRNTEVLSSVGLNLPSYVGLTESEVDRVCRALKDVLARGQQ